MMTIEVLLALIDLLRFINNKNNIVFILHRPISSKVLQILRRTSARDQNNALTSLMKSTSYLIKIPHPKRINYQPITIHQKE